MRSVLLLRLVVVCAFISLSSSTILAQGACSIAIPCQKSTTSDQNAFAITNQGGGRAAAFVITDPLNTRPALEARTSSTVSNASAVYGRVATPSPGHMSSGVRGINNGQAGPPDGVRIGVWGQAHAGLGLGVLGDSQLGVGVSGTSEAGRAMSAVTETGIALYAQTTDPAANVAVWGDSLTRAVMGTQGNTSCEGTYAVGACATTGDGLVARASTGRAGFFEGNVEITGSLTKASGTFKIDHPQDPQNRYLSHSFVESNDMLTIYTGNIVLDAEGRATVTMPAWFEALNREFRYQLTAIGAPAPSLYVAEEVAQHSFKIAGGQPGMKVSWQITAIRNDPYARQNPTPVEEWKTAAERGKYLHPAAYGQPREMGVNHVQKPDSPGRVSPLAQDRR